MKLFALATALVAAAAGWWYVQPTESGTPSAARTFASNTDAGTEAPETAPSAVEDTGPYWIEAWDALERGEVERTEELLEEYLAERAPAAAVYEMLSTLARRDGDLATSLDYARKAVELEPERSMAHVALTRAIRPKLMELGPLKAMFQLGELKDTMARAVELDPTNDEALIDQAYYLLYVPGIAGGDLDAVPALAELLAAVDPPQAQALQMQLLARQEKVDEAIAFGRSAIAEHPESQVLHAALGMILVEQEQFDAAEVELRAAHDGPSILSRYNSDYALAKILLEAERDYDEAETLLEGYLDGMRRADVMMPAAAVHWRLGMAREGQGRIEEARADYEQALSLDPDFEQAQASLEELGE